MALLRSVAKKDLKAVLALAKELDSYNLPYDRRAIRKLIHMSVRSFQGKVPKAKAKYLFVIEDASSKEIFGSSLIVAKQGTPASPHIYFENRRGVLHFGATRNGPTEIGGLILKRAFRRRQEKYGKQISWIRFLYMALHPERFEKKILAEFLPPLPKGRSLFWECVGRCFTGLSYREADHLSVYTKQFIFDLFPKKMRMASLPKEVRGFIGKVAPEAEGACNMLQRIGFHRTERIEPFDGGPYYEATRNKITIVRKAIKSRFGGRGILSGKGKQALFLFERRGNVRASVGMGEHRKGKLFLDEATIKLLRLRRGEVILAIPF